MGLQIRGRPALPWFLLPGAGQGGWAAAGRGRFPKRDPPAALNAAAEPAIGASVRRQRWPTSITKAYPGARLLGVTEVPGVDGGAPRYQAEVVLGRRPAYLLFDAQGAFLSDSYTSHAR